MRRLGERLLGCWSRDAEGILDVAVCLGLTGFTQVVVWSGQTFAGARVPNSLALLVMTAALLRRRDRGNVVLVVVAGAVVAQALVYGGTESAAVLLPFLVAVYSAAAYGGPLSVTAPVALFGILVHDLRDPLVDGASELWFSPLVTSTALVLGRVVHARRAQAQRAEARAEEAERDRESRIEQAVRDEQARLSREIHDVVAHSVSVMALQAGAAEQVLDSSPEQAREVLRRIRETGHEAVREMGRLLALERPARDQDPDRHPTPTLDALPALVERARGSGLDVRLHVTGAVRPLPESADTALFRIAQEGVTNALKHAPAASTVVELTYAPDRVTLDVRSDGVVSPTAAAPGTGRGLDGIVDRAAALGGHAEAGPQGPDGWRLSAVLPVPA